MIKKALSLLVATGLLFAGFTPAQAQWNTNRRIPTQFTNNAPKVAHTTANPYTTANFNARQTLYNYAKQGNTNGMRQVLQRYQIDTPDYNGNSLLCESVYKKDYAAFTTLKRMGASTTHSCINKIPDKTVAEFNQEYMNWAKAVNAGKITYGTAGKATTAVATTTGLSTGAMVGIGVGAAALIGGGIAIASSGGSSSSSSAPAVVCSGNGTKDADGNCQCNTGYSGENCSDCANTHVKQDGICYLKLDCVNGSQVKDKCKCSTGWDGDLCSIAESCDNYQASCPAGYDSTTTCKHGDDTWYSCDKCDSSHIMFNQVCYDKIDCKHEGSQIGPTECECAGLWTGDTCTICNGFEYENGCYTPLTCGVNKHQEANACVCDADYPVEYLGSCYATLNCGENGSQQGGECSCNTGYTGDTCSDCISTYKKIDNACYLDLHCDTSKHYHQEANACVCDTGFPHEYNGQCYAAIAGGCGTNKHQQGDACVCDTGYKLSGDTCVLDQCPANQYKSGDTCKSCPENSTSPAGSTSSDACVCNDGYSKSSVGICVENKANQTGTGSVFKLGVDTGYKVYTNNDNLTVSAANKPGLSVLNNGTAINKGNITGEAQEYQDSVYQEIPGYGGVNIPTDGFGGIQGMTGYFDKNAPNNSSIIMINNGDINLTHKGEDEWEDDLDYAMAGMLIATKYNTQSTFTKERNVSVQDYSVDIENNGNITVSSEKNEYAFDDYGIAVMPGLKNYIEGALAFNSQYISPTSSLISISNKGVISLNSDTAHSGIYTYSSGGSVNIENFGTISLNSAGQGVTLEGTTTNGNVSNLGSIQVLGVQESTKGGFNNVETLYGIKAIPNTNIDNKGSIILNSGTVIPFYGIYNAGGNVLNNTNGVITMSGSAFGKGIYIDFEKENIENFSQNSVTIENKGTINAGTGIEFKLEGINATNTPTINIVNSGTINNLTDGSISSSSANYSGGVGIALDYNTNAQVENDYNITIENSGTINTKDSKGTGILGSGEVVSNTIETITNSSSGIINGSISAKWGMYGLDNGATVINSGKIYSKEAFSSIVSGKKIQNFSSGTIEYEADMSDYLVSGNPLTVHMSGLTEIYNYGTLKNVGLWGVTGTNGTNIYNYGNIALDYDIDDILIKGKYVYNEADIDTKGFTGLNNAILYGNIIENKGDLTLNDVEVNAIYGGDVTNSGKIQINGSGRGIIGSKIHNSADITLTGNGTGILNNALDEGTIVAVDNEADISIGGSGTGIYAIGNVENSGNISLKSGTGIEIKNSSITNTGNITITEGDSYSIGIKAVDGSVNNSGDITMNAGTGIDGKNTAITNTGTITITAQSGVGIRAEGGTVNNSGTITIAGESKVGEEALYCATHNCYYYTIQGGTTMDGPEKGYYKTATFTGTNYHLSDYYAMTPNFVVLVGGAKLASSGTVNMSSVPLAFSSFSSDGTGVVEALPGAQFISQQSISDNLYMSNEFVTNNFKDSVVAENMIQTPDASGLRLISQSAMFDAKLADNGSDVVMKRKAFSSLTNNSSLANFLEQNYAFGNNEKFFNELKEIGSTSAFKTGLNSLTGMDVLNRFAYEDLTAVREMNLAMNQQMFANDDKNIFSTQGSVNNFSFKNGEASSGQFALGNRKVSPNLRVGYAMSVTRLNTNDEENDNSRNSTIFQMAMPFNYNTKGLKMISTPMAGFARGHYNRTGFNDTSYDGIIEKRMFGLMNEARYPFKVGGFELSPAFELNAIAYNQKGGEDNKPYSLTIESDNNLSLEAGIGMYASKEYEFSKDAKLNLNAGMMLYREFADPYNMKLGMQGMSGSFDLYDEDRSAYRGVASFGLDYKAEDLDIYGTVQHYMEDENHTNIKSGLKWKF